MMRRAASWLTSKWRLFQVAIGSSWIIGIAGLIPYENGQIATFIPPALKPWAIGVGVCGAILRIFAPKPKEAEQPQPLNVHVHLSTVTPHELRELLAGRVPTQP